MNRSALRCLLFFSFFLGLFRAEASPPPTTQKAPTSRPSFRAEGPPTTQKHLSSRPSDCDHGGAEDCFQKGRASDEEPSGSGKAKARVFLQKACDQKHGESCGDLAWMLAYGIGGSEDKAQARAFYQKACDFGHGSSCDRLKEMQK